MSGRFDTLIGMPRRIYAALCAVLIAVAVSACGSSSGASSSSGGGSGAANGASALSADAKSAATGDIPDNQVFLVFTNKTAGYSIKYPEGWTQGGAGNDVTFRDKNNLVRVAITSHATATPAAVATQLARLKRSDPTLHFRPPQIVKIGATHAVKAVYTTRSQPNPVTGKRVTLTVDRYELGGGAHVATVDLGTPVGVDNVDAYRLMIESFRWR